MKTLLDCANCLTASELERLAILQEELAEAQQVIGKILRHGYDSSHPELYTNNREDLEKELGHVQNAIKMMVRASDIQEVNIEKAKNIKAVSINRWLHHNTYSG